MTSQPHSSILIDVGARLRQERLRLGYFQDDFARLGGASLPTQGRYESGQTLPKIEYLFALAEHGVDPGYVVTGIRHDGSLGAVEQQILNDFRALRDEEKEAIMIVLATMASGPMLTPDEFIKGLAQRPGALHSPSLEYKAEPGRDEE